jgi:hypothetical protein
MNTTPPLIKPPPPPSAGNLRCANPSARPPHSENSPGSELAEDLLLTGIVPYGLPSGLLLAGWTLLVLSLAGPFLVLVTIVLAMSVVVAVIAAAVVLPYLLVRSVHRYWSRRPSRSGLSHRVHPRHASRQGFPTRRRGAPVINPPAAQIPATAQLYAAARLHAAVHPQAAVTSE